jgi:hypothetical protein
MDKGSSIARLVETRLVDQFQEFQDPQTEFVEQFEAQTIGEPSNWKHEFTRLQPMRQDWTREFHEQGREEQLNQHVSQEKWASEFAAMEPSLVHIPSQDWDREFERFSTRDDEWKSKFNGFLCN